MTSWSEARCRAEMVAAGAVLSQRGLIRAREGNLSCRLDDGRLLVTPRGAWKGRLTGAALVAVEEGGPLPPQASSESLVHVAVYEQCPHVRALVHAHPPAVLGLWRRRPSMPAPDISLLPEGRAVLGAVTSVPAITPGSRELAQACARAMTKAAVVIMAGHGVIAGGATVAEALDRVEVIELLARIELSRAG